MPRHKNSNGEGRVFLRGEIWYISFTSGGITRKESSGSTRQKDAIALRKKRIVEFSMHGAVSTPDKKIKVGDLLSDLLLRYRRDEHKSVDRWSQYAIRPLEAYFGSSRATQVNSGSLQGYIEFRKKPSLRFPEGRSNSTINREIALLRKAFNLAKSHHPPKITFLPSFPSLPEGQARRGFFEPAEYQALLAALSPDIRPLVVFGYNTGCRRTEIQNLLWEQVDFERGLVELRAGETKNDEARKIPMTPEVRALLLERRALRDELWPSSPWVFFREGTGSKILSFATAWANAVAEIKPGALFHDFRRTAVRNMIRAGVSQTVAMKISGHKDASIFARYNITSEVDLLEAAALVSLYHQKKAASAESGEVRV